MSQFVSGLTSYTRVPAALSRYSLWGYQLIPAVVSLLLSSGMLVAMFYATRGLAVWVDGKVQLPIQWLDLAVTWATGILGFVVMILGFLFLHKHIVIVILSPFLSRISETIVRAELGPQPDSVVSKGGTLQRSLIINTRSVLLEIGLSLLLIALGFVIPVLSPFTSLTVVLVEARFVGNGLMDFPLEYRGFSVCESVTWSRRHKATATGIGSGYLLLMLVPVVGWMFAPTFGVVAGTLASLKSLEADNKHEDSKA